MRFIDRDRLNEFEFYWKQVFRRVGMGVALTAVFLLAACGGGEEPAPEAPAPVEVEEDSSAEAEEVVAEVVEEPTEEPTPEPEPTEEPAPTVEPTPTIEPTPERPTVSLPSGEYIFSNGNKVRDIALFDNAIWAPSTGGLVRFDLASGESRKYTTFDGLPNIGTYTVEVCPVDGADRLIVGTREGLILYDAAADSWESGSVIGFTSDDAIHEMRCDAANNRLVLEHDDLSILDLGSKTLTHYTEDDNGLAWFAAEQVIVIGDDIWWPTDFKGISRVGLDGTVETFTEETGLPDENVSDVALDANGVYWMGASDGLLQWQGGEFTLFTRDTHPDLIDFFGPDHVETAVDGTLWLGFHSDICQFDATTMSCPQLFDLEDDLGLADGASIAHLEATADGGLLMHTFDEGSAYYDGSAWTTFVLADQTPSNYFYELFEASDGTIWTIGDGTHRTDLEMSSYQRFSDFWADDIAEDAEGNLWMVNGSRLAKLSGQQLIIMEEEDGIVPLSYDDIAVADDGTVYIVGSNGYSIVQGDNIIAVGEDQGWDLGSLRDVLVVDGVAYAGTVNGLVTLDGETWTVVLDETFVELPDDNIGALNVLSDGTMLLGTTEGLAMFKDGVVTAVPEVLGSVQDIFVTEDDQIHIVTIDFRDGGYYHFDGAAWTYRPAEEFPMESLRTVMVDAAGTVWIGLGDTGLGGAIYRIVP